MYETQQERQMDSTMQNQYKEQQLMLYQPSIPYQKSNENYYKKRDYLINKMYHRNLEINKMSSNMYVFYEKVKMGMSESNEHPIIVKEVKRMESKEMVAIKGIYNKLKVLTSKVKGIQSGKFHYPVETFISKVLQMYKEEEKTIIGELVKNKTIIDTLLQIKKNFGIVNERGLKFYKIQHTSYLQSGYLQETVIFYINFNVQKLLFLNRKPLLFTNQLLYCPIVLSKQLKTVQISQWYLNKLSQVDDQWQRYLIKIYVYHKSTSMTSHIYTSYLRNMIILEPPFHTPSFLSKLKMIRNFVYQSLLWNWLSNILDSDNNRFYVDIGNSYRVEIVNERMIGKMSVEDGFRPQLMASLILMSNENSNMNKSGVQLKQSISIMLEGLVFGMIAQKAEYRINFTPIPGSLGQFYFDRRSSIRKSVGDFLEQF